jgi:hypothetical protein
MQDTTQDTAQDTAQNPTRETTRETTPSPETAGPAKPTSPLMARPVSRSAKSQYSEAEAAAELGITVDALRKVIRSHVVDRDEDLGNIPATTFQPSDLLVLRLLSGKAAGWAGVSRGG